MVLTHPTQSAKFVMSRRQKHNLTHYICYPLVTASSRPLLQRSMGLLRDNPASANFPSGAFVPLDTLHLNAGINMSLPTSGRFADAEKLLRSLDLNSLTTELSAPSFEKRSVRQKFLDIERSLSLSAAIPMTRPLPLHLTLRGLHATPRDLLGLIPVKLYAQCHESTSRLRHLCNNLAIIFAAAGLYDPSSEHPFRRNRLKTTGSPLENVSLIKTSFIRSAGVVPSPIQPGKLQQKPAPIIEPRELVRVFRDFVWAENIKLDRLSICPLGLYKRIRKEGSKARLCEECSVPLP